MHTITYEGIDPAELERVLASGVDHGGNPIEPYIDDEGGMPLRCCMADAVRGDRLAIIAWSPFRWQNAYRETGPIVVHTEGCEPVASLDALPPDMNLRPMILRPYGPDHTIAYHHVRQIPAAEGLGQHVEDLLALDDVELVQGRNPVGGCYAFTASPAARSTNR